MGTAFDHPWRRTVAETDNMLFSGMTVNPACLPLDAAACRRQAPMLKRPAPAP